MKRIRKILVCLDLSEYDRSCVQHARLLASRLAEVEEVVLFHNIRFDFIHSLESFDEKEAGFLKVRIETYLSANYSDLFGEIVSQLVIRVEDYRDTVVAIDHVMEADPNTLVVFGNKAPARGSGEVSFRVLSLKSLSSPVLLCPPNERSGLSSIAVALDLESKGRDPVLVDFANDLGGFFPEANMIGIHVNKIPAVYFPYFDRDDQRLEEELSRNSRKKFDRMAGRLGQNLDHWNLVMISGKDISKTLIAYLGSKSLDLLIIGKHASSLEIPGVLGGNARKTALQTTSSAILLL